MRNTLFIVALLISLHTSLALPTVKIGNVATQNVTCTDCINTYQIPDIYVFNTGDTMTGNLLIGTNQIFQYAGNGTIKFVDGYIDNNVIITKNLTVSGNSTLGNLTLLDEIYGADVNLGFTNLTTYPTACTNQFVQGVGDVLTCNTVSADYIGVGVINATHLSSNVNDSMDLRYVNVGGDTMTGDLILNDNVNLYAGTGSDLRLYHDGSNSWISNSLGALLLENTAAGGGVQARIGGVFIIEDRDDASVDLFTLDTGTRTLAIGAAADTIATTHYGNINVEGDINITGDNLYSQGVLYIQSGHSGNYFKTRFGNSTTYLEIAGGAIGDLGNVYIASNKQIHIQAGGSTDAMIISSSTQDTSLENNLLLNIGDANTDFTTGGGLDIAGVLKIGGGFGSSGATLDSAGNAWFDGNVTILSNLSTVNLTNANMTGHQLPDPANTWLSGNYSREWARVHSYIFEATTNFTSPFFMANSTKATIVPAAEFFGTLALNDAIIRADSSGYLQNFAGASNWGIYWNTATNAYEFHNTGSSKLSIDLDTGDLIAVGIVEAQDYLKSPELWGSTNLDIRPNTAAFTGTTTLYSGNAAANAWVSAVSIISGSNEARVGIGNTTPTVNLHVVGTSNFTSNLTVQSGNLTVGTNTLFANPTTGNVGIGTATPQAKLEMGSGNILFAGTGIINFSNVNPGGLNFTGDVDGDKLISSDYGGALWYDTTYADNLIFQTWRADGYGDRLYLSSGGSGTSDLLLIGEGKVGFCDEVSGAPAACVTNISLGAGISTIDDFNITGNNIYSAGELFVQSGHTGNYFKTTFGNATTYLQITGGAIADLGNTYIISNKQIHIQAGSVDAMVISSSTQDTSLENNLLLNIGDANTDFTTGGGLNIAGDVGIGTTVYESDLSVAGVGGAINSGGYIEHIGGTDSNTDPTRYMLGFSHGNTFTDANVRAGLGMMVTPGGAGNLIFETGSGGAQAERMRITGTGKVGINTTTPVALLDISATGDGTELLRLSAERAWTFRQGNAGPSTQLELNALVNDKAFNITSLDRSSIAYFLASNTDADSRVILVPDGGNVGIGNLTPTVKLHVVGTSNFTSNLTVQSGNLTVGTNTLFANPTTGRVGIGTTSPTGSLEIATSAGVEMVGSDASDNAFNINVGSDLFIDLDNDDDQTSAFYIREGSNNVVFSVGENGDVNITDISPVLYLNATGGIPLIRLIPSGTNFVQIRLDNSDSTQQWVIDTDGGGADIGEFGIYDTDRGAYAIRIANGTAGAVNITSPLNINTANRNKYFTYAQVCSASSETCYGNYSGSSGSNSLCYTTTAGITCVQAAEWSTDGATRNGGCIASDTITVIASYGTDTTCQAISPACPSTTNINTYSSACSTSGAGNCYLVGSTGTRCTGVPTWWADSGCTIIGEGCSTTIRKKPTTCLTWNLTLGTECSWINIYEVR